MDPSALNAIVLSLDPLAQAHADAQVARALRALAQGELLAPEPGPHTDALHRLAWLAFVRAPSLHTSAFATVPMMLSLIEAGSQSLDALVEYVRTVEDSAMDGEGIAALLEPGSLGPRVATLQGEPLRELVRESLMTLRRSPAALDQAIEAATGQVVGHLEQAMADGAFDDRIEQPPEAWSMTWVERGLQRYAQRDLKGALQAFDKALEALPDNTRALTCRGEILMLLGDDGGAQQDYEASLRIEKTPGAHAGYAALLLKHDELEVAFAHANAALSLDENDLSSLLNRGLIFRLAGRHDEARADYQRAAALAPRVPTGAVGLGQIALDQGDFATAEAHFSSALEAAPGLPEALFGRALARRATGDKAGAEADLDQAAPFAHVEGNRLYDAARWRSMLGNLSGALADYDQALTLNPSDTQALINRGVILQSLERHDEALESFERAVASNPSYPNSYVKRGMLRFLLGQSESARRDLEHALAIAPADWPLGPDVSSALTMIAG